MLLPVGDDDRALFRPAYVTHFLLWTNVFVFLLQQVFPSLTYGWSMVPLEISSGKDIVGLVALRTSAGTVEIMHYPGPVPIYLTLLTSMFLHGSLLHIAGNMLYLWIFGDNVEHRFGSLLFLGFYLIAGVAGALVEVAFHTTSVVPVLGASGAISGVLGAYLVLFPKNRVYVLFFFTVLALPASLVIGGWVLFQLLGGVGSIMGPQVGGVAYLVHLGGFVTGALLAWPMRKVVREREHHIFRRVVPDYPH